MIMTSWDSNMTASRGSHTPSAQIGSTPGACPSAFFLVGHPQESIHLMTQFLSNGLPALLHALPKAAHADRKAGLALGLRDSQRHRAGFLGRQRAAKGESPGARYLDMRHNLLHAERGARAAQQIARARNQAGNFGVVEAGDHGPA